VAYTTEFTNDVFISFAHVDNTENWVTELHRQLQDRFVQLGADVTIWRDKKLSKADEFSPEIFDQLRKTAVLVSVITPRCIHSNWCADERRKFEFFATLNGGLRIGNTPRAFNVIKTPLEGDRHRGLFGSLGFEFYARDRDTTLFAEYQPESVEFRNRVNELALTVLNLLKLVAARRLPPRRNAVYIALTTPDLKEIRAKVVEELSALELAVLPTENFVPIDTVGFREAVEACLTECKVSVHFGSPLRGPIPEGEEESAPVLQYRMAASASLPRVIWIRPETDIAPDFRMCLKEVGLQGADLLDKPTLTVEDLKSAIRNRIRILDDAPSVRPDPAQRVSVYLLCEGADHPAAQTSDQEIPRQVAQYLNDKGYTVWLPPVNITNEQLREDDHKETLEVSDAVLLLWGVAGEYWFRKRLRELATIETRRSHRPMYGRALLFAKPPDGKGQYHSFLDLSIEQFSEFEPDRMKPFDDLISRRGHG
jgi:hypothetical protein